MMPTYGRKTKAAQEAEDSCSKWLLNADLAAQWVFNFGMACMVGPKTKLMHQSHIGWWGFHSDWSGSSVDAFMNAHGSNYGSMPLPT
jgi:hypothetical protein